MPLEIGGCNWCMHAGALWVSWKEVRSCLQAPFSCTAALALIFIAEGAHFALTCSLTTTTRGTLRASRASACPLPSECGPPAQWMMDGAGVPVVMSAQQGGPVGYARTDVCRGCFVSTAVECALPLPHLACSINHYKANGGAVLSKVRPC